MNVKKVIFYINYKSESWLILPGAGVQFRSVERGHFLIQAKREYEDAVEKSAWL
jgi:hypothetical protein